MELLRAMLSRRRFARNVVAPAALSPVLAACGGGNTPPQTGVVGAPRTAKSRVLETGADMLQGEAPLDAMSLYLDGFHFYADDLGRQVEAHHYCTHLTEDFHQCVIFDSNGAKARLIGIEYIVSERVFRGLAEDEQRLWHSHHYEVKSGALIAPGVPAMAERAALADIVTTYGKTWHCWQVDRGDELPLGIPQLMMGFTRDGQIDPQLLEARDRRFGISSAAKRRERADIPMPTVQPGANAWESGRTAQLELATVPVRNRR
jgi:hypothetical protein